MNDIQPKRLTRRVIPLDRIEREGDLAAKELAQELLDDMVANAGALDVGRLNRGGPQVRKIYMKLLAQAALPPDSPVTQGRALKPTPPATAKRASGPIAPASGGPATMSPPSEPTANTPRPASVDSTATKIVRNQPVAVLKERAAASLPTFLQAHLSVVWPVFLPILPNIFAVIFIAVLTTLLTCTGLESELDVDREPKIQGLSNVVSGLLAVTSV